MTISTCTRDWRLALPPYRASNWLMNITAGSTTNKNMNQMSDTNEQKIQNIEYFHPNYQFCNFSPQKPYFCARLRRVVIKGDFSGQSVLLLCMYGTELIPHMIVPHMYKITDILTFLFCC